MYVLLNSMALFCFVFCKILIATGSVIIMIDCVVMRGYCRRIDAVQVPCEVKSVCMYDRRIRVGYTGCEFVKRYVFSNK